MSGSRRKPGPLGPFVEGYRAWLLGRGYSQQSQVRPLQGRELDVLRLVVKRHDEQE